MSSPIRHLPVIQNWDCHGCTNCCRDYVVHVTDEERRRILAQSWDTDADIGDLPLFVRSGPWWHRRWRLTERGNGDCVFLSPQGRCRIHERFGGDAKPLTCRLFPFVLVPAGDHWRVGLRYACPSVASNKGRALAAHDESLVRYAAELEQREGRDTRTLPPPSLQAGQRVDWPDLLRFVQALLDIVRNRKDGMERRLRKCLALAKLCRQARFDKVRGERLAELLRVIATGLESDVPADPAALESPGWIGRVLFRQALAIFLRKDHGPNRGPVTGSRLVLARAAWSFLRGIGSVPRMDARLPETSFERMEEATGQLPEAAEEVLERYYTIKVGSLQFCGPTNFRYSLWGGLESLALTLPVVLWLTRAFAGLPREEAVVRAIHIVDDHFGFNPILGTGRQRYALSVLSRFGELEKLIAWYSR